MAPPSKKRKIKESATAEIIFDPSARFDYLTGFHKRKVQRLKQAQEAAARRARQEKIDDRKKLREERKAELERHVQQVNAMLPSHRPVADSGDSSQDEDDMNGWDGIPESTQHLVDHEDEYVDEDKYTTVTVEEVDITRDGISRLKSSDEDSGEDEAARSPATSGKHAKTISKHTSRDKGNKRPKKKRKSFRYESQAERKLNRAKERARKSKAARLRRGD